MKDTDIIAKLKQYSFMRGRRSFTLRDNGDLLASYEGGGINSTHTIKVGNLDSNSRIEKNRAITRLVLCIFTMIPGPLLLFLGIVGIMSDSGSSGSVVPLMVVGVVFTIFAIGLLRAYFQHSYNLTLFQPLRSGDGVLLFTNKPTKAEFSEFVLALQTEIQKHQIYEQDFGFGSDLASQLQKLSALKNSGVLTDAEFTEAKAKLIQTGVANGPIGFHP